MVENSINRVDQPPVDNLLTELRKTTFELFLLGVGIAAAILLWLGNMYSKTSTSQIILFWLLLEVICVASWWLHNKTLSGAILLLMVGLWGINALAAQQIKIDAPILLYLFALISLAASVLMDRFTALVITVLSSGYIFMTHGTGGAGLFPVLMIWFTLLTGFVAFHSLSQALDMAWSYQDYAIRQMSEARDHRANLVQTTRVLEELRRDLERANSQLMHAHRAAEEARRLKSQFAATVSHELRTPINLIVGFSETIVQSSASYGVALPSAYWTDMNTIYRSAKHLQSLINDVLDMSQIEAGKMVIVKEEIDSRQVIEEAATIARDLIESRGLTFKIDLLPSMPMMYLDRTRIRQVILNLLSNAARFTPDGSITMNARIEEGHLVISVKDTGVGIPAADLDRVFEEFYQVEGSLARKQGGSGLGLTLSKHFVEQHGGRIDAESDGIPGQGSTFTITIPLMDSRIGARPGTGPLGGESKDGARYFVVLDDDPAIQQLFRRYSSKHRAVPVRTEEDALRMIETIRPAAVIMNDHLDQTRLMDDLRERDNQTPVIACAMPSAQPNLDIPKGAAYLPMPITAESLQETMSKLDPRTNNILIITSDQELMRLLLRNLQAMRQGYQLWRAYSGEEGVALMTEQPPDVVILDMRMSTSADDEAPLLEHVMLDSELSRLPLILTGSDEGESELTPADEGHIRIDRITGFQPMELLRIVESVIDGLKPVVTPVLSQSPGVETAGLNK